MRKDEQETIIHYDVLTKQTTFYSSYPPDIRKYLLSDGVKITRTVIENDIVVAVEGHMLDGYSLSRKPRKNPEITDEQKYILVARLEQIRNSNK